MDNAPDMKRRDALKLMAAAGVAALTGLPASAGETSVSGESGGEKKFAVAINGSPRKGGNTERMLTRALEPLKKTGWETELVQIGGRTIRGCRACFACRNRKDNTCVTSDIFNEVFQKMLRADAIIIGSPTYVSDVTAETKALIDRSVFVALANEFSLRGKIGAAVAVHRRAGAVNVFDTINRMFLMALMVVPGSFYWNMGVGTQIGDVDNDAEGNATMLHLGQTIDLVATAIRPLRGNWPEVPKFR